MVASDSKTKAIILLAYGKKGRFILDLFHSQWLSYAANVDADLLIISNSLDPAALQFTMAQKLLIPAAFARYKYICYVDLDIVISPNSPDVFQDIDSTPFQAFIPNIKSSEYINTCHNFFGVSPVESCQEFFQLYGLNPSLQAVHFNTGVFICNTKLCANLFCDYYHQYKSFHHLHNACELLMGMAIDAHLECSPLDARFNYQPLFTLYGNNIYSPIRNSVHFKLSRKIELSYPNYRIPYPSAYVQFVHNMSREAWFIHFAGKLPYLNFANNLF